MYLHCPSCQASIPARLIGPSFECPRCGEPATEPLSFFSSMPDRYRRRTPGARAGRFAPRRSGQRTTPHLTHR